MKFTGNGVSLLLITAPEIIPVESLLKCQGKCFKRKFHWYIFLMYLLIECKWEHADTLHACSPVFREIYDKARANYEMMWNKAT